MLGSMKTKHESVKKSVIKVNPDNVQPQSQPHSITTYPPIHVESRTKFMDSHMNVR